MKNFLLLFCLISFQFYNAQSKKSLENNLFKINILTPGICYERALSDKTSICTDANLSIGFNNRNNKTLTLFSPFLRSQFRVYYNLEKKQLNKRDVSKNSANYIALQASYYFKPINNTEFVSTYDGLTPGLVWGFQKTYKSRLNLGANLGMGYNLSSNKAKEFVPIVNFTLGWVIN